MCASMNMSSSTFTCRLIDFTLTDTTCLCSAEDNTISGSNTIADINVATILDTSFEDFVSTWEFAAHIDAGQLAKSINVVLLLSGIVTWFILGLIFLPFLDQRSKRKIHNESEEKSQKVNDDDIDVGTVDVPDASKNFTIIEKRLLEAIPECFTSRFSVYRLARELPRHHRWLSPLFHYSESTPRLYRMLSLVNQFAAQLFFTVIFFNRYN